MIVDYALPIILLQGLKYLSLKVPEHGDQHCLFLSWTGQNFSLSFIDGMFLFSIRKLCIMSGWGEINGTAPKIQYKCRLSGVLDSLNTL